MVADRRPNRATLQRGGSAALAEIECGAETTHRRLAIVRSEAGAAKRALAVSPHTAERIKPPSTRMFWPVM